MVPRVVRPEAPRHHFVLYTKGSTMSFPQPAEPGNPAESHNWTDEVREQARVALFIATNRDRDDRVLGYYVRSAIAHGMTIDEVCRAANLSASEVRELSDPAVA